VAAAASYLEQQVALSRLAHVHLDQTKLDAAWAAAPQALRDGHHQLTEAFLDGRGTVPISDWEPVYRAPRLRASPDAHAGGVRPLTPERAAVRDYFFARELQALIVERMTAPPSAERTVSDDWVLDFPPDAERYFPPKAQLAGAVGRTQTECT